jgi:DNA polymerase-1
MTEKQVEKKLFLLDAMALIYRAFFAFSKNPRYNSKGLNTSAIFGFTNTLLEVINKQKPTHIAVAFDTEDPTARHEEFADYKAHRDAIPEDIALSIPYIQSILKGFRIPVITKPGFEADDIIGTLAKKAEQHDYKVFMMTPDKDFAQLVSENIFIFKPASFGKGPEILGIPEVLEKFSISNVDQVRDLLGLWGDAADNIPGIPGVGEKTAKLLIAEYGSIENLIEKSSSLKDKMREKVESHADQALLSKRLATILCDVPLEFNEEELIMEEPDKEILSELFADLEFKGLAKRLFEDAESIVPDSKPIVKDKKGQHGLFDVAEEKKEEENKSADESTSVSHFKTILDLRPQYHLVDTAEQRKKLVDELKHVKSCCFDLETTNIDANNAELVGLAFSWKFHEGFYVSFPPNYAEACSILNEFKDFFEDESIEKCGQNLKYDMSVLKWYEIEVKGKIWDTMLAHYLIEPDMRHNMDLLSNIYLSYAPISIKSLIGEKKSEQINMREVDVEKVCEYACEDADVTFQLKAALEPELKSRSLEFLFNSVETPLIEVLVDMETEGVAIDKSVLSVLSKELETDIVSIENNIYDLAGSKFNIASPRQLGEILFDQLKIDDKAKKTKTGQYATGEEVLSKLTGKHPIVERILDYRELQKLKNTYVDTLPSMVSPRTGRIHTSFNQAVAATGRLSSNNPNLQNIPIRTEKGREIRRAFIPRNEDYILISADYSQIELRIIAEICKDTSMIEAFKQKQDVHSATASKIYAVELNEVTSEMRRNAKMVNFGIIYGISAFGLSQRLNIPRKEAAFIIEQYFAKYPSIKNYMDDSIQFARDHGYVETMLGRKRYLKDINSQNAVIRGFAERNAINAPIQGSAADMIKVAMINIYKDFRKMNLKSKMILQVHDELVFDAHKDEVEMIRPIIEERMKNAIPLTVPVEVEIGSGNNWLEAH